MTASNLPIVATKSLVLLASVDHIVPPIWRRIAVPQSIRLDHLHLVLQIAFDWDDSHLWQFSVGTADYVCEIDDDFGPPRGRSSQLARKSTLMNALGTKKKINYWYDFGDDWHVTLKVERRVESDSSIPHCEAGERAGPPDDCGGLPGYFHLCEALADKNHESHQDMIEWIGDFDPSSFAVDVVNQELKEVFAPRPKREAKAKKLQ
jgi:hypothetical protein